HAVPRSSPTRRSSDLGGIGLHGAIRKYAVMKGVTTGRGAALVEPIGEVARNRQGAVRRQHQTCGGREVVVRINRRMLPINQHDLSSIPYLIGVDQTIRVVDARPVRVEEREVGKGMVSGIVNDIIDTV